MGWEKVAQFEEAMLYPKTLFNCLFGFSYCQEKRDSNDKGKSGKFKFYGFGAI
jgi:hypothetical protein